MTAPCPFAVEPRVRPRLGLIALRVDETIESDLARMVPPEAAQMHVSRVQSGDDLTPQSIAAMEDRLAGAAALLPPVAYAAVGYGCTSGAAQIGPDRVAQAVRAGVRCAAVTDPMTAAIAACHAAGIARVAVLSPYTHTVGAPVADAFARAGIVVAATHSFGEAEEARVARIAPGSIAAAARSLARGARADALFLSCTNLRASAVQNALASELGLPVLSSNGVLAWHMARLAGLPAAAVPLPGLPGLPGAAVPADVSASRPAGAGP